MGAEIRLYHYWRCSEKILNRGEAGDNVGILLRGIEKTDIKRGMVICKPGSVTPHAKFKAEVYILKEEGGRHTPFHNNYRPRLCPYNRRYWKH